MTVEFARNRIVKIRSDYSKHDLNNTLGFNYNKDNKNPVMKSLTGTN